MKRMIVYGMLIGICACQTENKEGTNDEYVIEEPELKQEKEDSVIVADTIDTASNEQAEKVKMLLFEPIDLPQYKEEYGGANSGHGGDKSLFNVPDTTGFMYQYMLFYKLRNVLKSHPSEGELFANFRIKVFMYGEDVGRFSDNNEELMAIECAMDNTTLGELNVYGMTRSEIDDVFGVPQYEKEQHIIYEHEHNVLTIHFPSTAPEAKADWFKYARLNPSINLDQSLPDFLLKF